MSATVSRRSRAETRTDRAEVADHAQTESRNHATSVDVAARVSRADRRSGAPDRARLHDLNDSANLEQQSGEVEGIATGEVSGDEGGKDGADCVRQRRRHSAGFALKAPRNKIDTTLDDSSARSAIVKARP